MIACIYIRYYGIGHIARNQHPPVQLNRPPTLAPNIPSKHTITTSSHHRIFQNSGYKSHLAFCFPLFYILSCVVLSLIYRCHLRHSQGIEIVLSMLTYSRSTALFTISSSPSMFAYSRMTAFLTPTSSSSVLMLTHFTSSTDYAIAFPFAMLAYSYPPPSLPIFSCSVLT